MESINKSGRLKSFSELIVETTKLEGYDQISRLHKITKMSGVEVGEMDIIDDEVMTYAFDTNTKSGNLSVYFDKDSKAPTIWKDGNNINIEEFKKLLIESLSNQVDQDWVEEFITDIELLVYREKLANKVKVYQDKEQKDQIMVVAKKGNERVIDKLFKIIDKEYLALRMKNGIIIAVPPKGFKG